MTELTVFELKRRRKELLSWTRLKVLNGDQLPLESWPDHYLKSAGVWIQHQCIILSRLDMICPWPGFDTPARVIMLSACSYCFFAGPTQTWTGSMKAHVVLT